MRIGQQGAAKLLLMWVAAGIMMIELVVYTTVKMILMIVIGVGSDGDLIGKNVVH